MRKWTHLFELALLCSRPIPQGTRLDWRCTKRKKNFNWIWKRFTLAVAYATERAKIHHFPGVRPASHGKFLGNHKAFHLLSNVQQDTEKMFSGRTRNRRTFLLKQNAKKMLSQHAQNSWTRAVACATAYWKNAAEAHAAPVQDSNQNHSCFTVLAFIFRRTVST